MLWGDAYFKHKDVFYEDRVRIREVLEKLVKDGNATMELYDSGTKRGYKITFEGRFLISQGGYRDQALKSHRSARAEYIRNAILTTGGLMTAIGGFAAAVYYSLEIWKWFSETP